MPDIIVENLTKRYDGRAVLDGLSLTLSSGEISCLMAPSGAGKTTLLRLLAGLEAPDGGSVTGVHDGPIGMVFQEDRLLEWLDPVENLRLVSPGLTRSDALDALGRFGLGDSAGKPVQTLSGGMRRRVALLRALLSEAELLLLDEPFNGLDDQTRRQVIEETRALIRGRTTVLVTHDPEDAALVGGRVVSLE